jgi:phytoene dehydrogenase-like protein
MFPLTNRDRIGNLFYSGGSVQPGAGLPMVTISGQFAADLARKLL